MSNKVIFLHIPKTAGTTLSDILSRKYTHYVCEDSVRGFQKAVQSYKHQHQDVCLQGHFYFSNHTVDSSYYYVTMLRHPVERVISEYYFLLRSPYHPRYEELSQLSLEEYVNSTADTVYNKQTRMLTNDSKPNADEAIENLQKYFSVVGLTERFDESINTMKDKLHWSNDISYYNYNITKTKPKSEKIDQHVIEQIKENNKEDMKLYYWTESKFKLR